MSPLDYSHLFNPWEIAIVKSLIQEYKRKWKYLRHEDIEDLLQDCFIHWYRARDKYDPAKNISRKTFMRQVIRNKLKDIVENLYADKRKILYKTIPLEDLIKRSESTKEQLPFIKGINPNLEIDLAKAIQKLTPRQKILCNLIGIEGLSIKEASKRLKIGRRTAHRELKRIENIFIKEGLKDYLT